MNGFQRMRNYGCSWQLIWLTDRSCQTFSFSISDLNHFVVNEKSIFFFFCIY